MTEYPTPPVTLEWVRVRWADARDIDDTTLSELVDTAWARCVPFLPAAQLAIYVDGTLPGGIVLRWREAVMLDARDLWRAAQRDGDVVAFDAYAMRVRPLSDTVRSLLRPRTGVPMVG